MTTLGEFLAAIREQESGGNYKVVNGIGAMGAYQIMPANLPSWSKAALGHSISESDFLSHPAEQDAIAAHELGPYFTKDGPRAAAAWWYSGQTDPTKTYGNPPVYQYVADVMSHLGHSGSVTVSGSGSDSAAPSDDVSGSTAQPAGLQQAGYEAALNLTPWGLPLNPFKLPGWLAGKLGDAAGDAAGGAVTGMWDAAGPVLLAGLGVATGAVLLVVGLYVTVKPLNDAASQKVESLLPAAL